MAPAELTISLGARTRLNSLTDAKGHMLGELIPLLSHAADKALRRSVAIDLTHCQGPELKQRVQQALRPLG